MEENAQNLKPANRGETGRNPDGTFKVGVSGNPKGRPKNTLKDYVRQKFMLMTDEEKEDFLEKIPPEIIWKMGEGNPMQNTDVTTDGESLNSISDEQADKILKRRMASISESGE